MSGDRLWAPWRLEYIKGPKPNECIFCAKPEIGDDRAAHIVRRGEHCFAMLNAFPYNNGHLMISPFAHVPSIEDLGADAVVELMTMAQTALATLREVYGPEGFNLGINQGKVAGAGVEGHIHLHIVPRWGADTNFMPVIGDTRVLPQSLDESFDEVSRAWAA
ncbi:MAG: HIT domain-containing protein [Actinomycetota bacterium]|nr:HIT domain-containing protein [Actinomycetota bacterium]